MGKNTAPKEVPGRRSSRHSDPAPGNEAQGNGAAATPASGGPRRTGRHTSTPVPDPTAVDKVKLESGAKTAPARTRRPASTPGGGAPSSSKTPAASAATTGSKGGQKRSRLARSAGPSNVSASRSLRRRGSVSFKETSHVDEDESSEGSSDEEEQKPEIIDETIYKIPAEALLPKVTVLELKGPAPAAENEKEGAEDENKEAVAAAPGATGTPSQQEKTEIIIPTAAMGELTAAYALLRSFSWQLRLSPFSFEDFCAAMSAPQPTVLMDEVHVCVLRALAFDEVQEEREERKLDLGMLDHLTWPCYVWEMLRLTVDPLAKHEWAQRLLEGIVPSIVSPAPVVKTPATGKEMTTTPDPADGVFNVPASGPGTEDEPQQQQQTTTDMTAADGAQTVPQLMEIDGVPAVDAVLDVAQAGHVVAEETAALAAAVVKTESAPAPPSAAPVPSPLRPSPRPSRAFEPVDIAEMDQQLHATDVNDTAAPATEAPATVVSDPLTVAEMFSGCAPAMHQQQPEYYSLPIEAKASILSRLCDHLLDCTTFRAEIDRREEEGLYVAGHGEDGGTFGLLTEAEKKRVAALAAKKQLADANTDACVICGVGGVLNCCDGCPAAYHGRCLGEKNKSKQDTKQEEKDDEKEWYCPECVIGGRGETAGLRIPVAARNKWKQPLHIINGAVVRTQVPAVQSKGRHVKELDMVAPVVVLNGTAAQEALTKSQKVKNVDEVPLPSSFIAVLNPSSHLPPPLVPDDGASAPVGTGPEAYNNKYRNAWTASAIALRSTIEDIKKRKTKIKLTIPTGTCGRLPVPKLPEPMPLSRFGWVQMQGRPGGRATIRCGKCHTCLRPTMRKGCMNPISRGPGEDSSLNALQQPQQPDTSKLSYLIAFVCKVEREFWALVEGPWATEPGGGMQFRARWAVNVRSASSAGDLAQSLLQLESLLRPVAFSPSWYGGCGGTTGGGSASQPGSRGISRSGSMMDVQGANGAAGAGTSSQQAAAAVENDGDDGPGSNKQKSTDPYDIRFEKLVKADWEMDRRSHAAHVASVNRLPLSLLKKAARHGGRQAIPGVQYKKQEWKLVSPRLAWVAEMEAVQTCAQLALAIRKLDAVLNWEGVAKPKGMASDAPFAQATVQGKRPVVTTDGGSPSSSSAGEYEYLIDMRQVSAVDQAALQQQHQQLQALFQQRLAMSQAQMLMQAQAQEQQQQQQQQSQMQQQQQPYLGPLAGLTAAFLGTGAQPNGGNFAAPGRLGSLNSWPTAAVAGGGGGSGFGAPVLQPLPTSAGGIPPLPPRPPLPTPPKQDEQGVAEVEATEPQPAPLPLGGLALPPGFPAFAGIATGGISALPPMQISMAPAPVVAVASAPAAVAKKTQDLTEDEKLTREIVENAIKKAIEAEEEERLLQMPAAMAAKLRRKQSVGGGGGVGDSSADLKRAESDATAEDDYSAPPTAPTGLPAGAAEAAAGFPPGLMPFFGMDMFSRPPALAPPPPTWTHERDIPLWFIRSYEELCRREAANVAARELQAAARRGSQMDSAIKEAARQAAQVAAQAAADACGICSAAQGDNPELDALWICCDTCNRWFHGVCVAMSQEDVNAIAEDEQWDCPGCSNARRKAERAARREGKTLPSTFSPMDLEPGKKQGRALKPFYEYADYKAGEAKMLEKLKRGEPLDGAGSRGKKRSGGGGGGASGSGSVSALAAETAEEAAARQAAKAELKKRKREEEARLAAEPIHCPVCQYPDFGRPLVECDACHRWFHYECVGTAIEEVQLAVNAEKTLHCAECQGKRVRPPTQAAIDAAILAAADVKGGSRKKMREDSVQPSPLSDGGGGGGSGGRGMASQPLQGGGPRGGISRPQATSSINWRDPVNKIIVKTMRLSVAGPFSRPVSLEDAPDYHEIIARPMDLDTLHSAIPRLNSPLDVLVGVKLIVDNCILYNGEKSDFAAAAVEMQQSFLKLWTAKGLPTTTEQWEAMLAGESLKPPREPLSDGDGASAGAGGAIGSKPAQPVAKKYSAVFSSSKKKGGFSTSLAALSPAPGASPAPDWTARASQALAQLTRLEAAELFLEPVSLDLVDYHNVIHRPMDIGTIQKRLLQGLYVDPSEIAADVAQVWTNCRLFNEPRAEINKDAAECERAFIKFWNAAGIYQGGGESLVSAGAGPSSGNVQYAAQNPRQAAPAAPVAAAQGPGVASRPQSSTIPDWQEAARRVLHRMITFVTQASWFVEPVSDEIAPDYRDVIARPMDLTTVLEKVKAGEYAEPAAVLADVDLIWNNSVVYNGSDHPITKDALKAKESFAKLWAAAGLDGFREQPRQQQQQQFGGGGGGGGSGRTTAPAPSQTINNNDWVSTVRRVLNGVMNLPDCVHFNGPISDIEKPEYSHVVTKHMDFGIILKNLGRGRYGSPIQVLEDVRLILNNWKKYQNLTGGRDQTYQIYGQQVAEALMQNWRHERLPS